jgi:hypothetical protein
MKLFLTLHLIVLFCLVSCDKAERLRAEQGVLQTKRAAVMNQIKELDAQLSTLGPHGISSVAPMTSQAEEMQSSAASLEISAAEALRKWGALEGQSSALQAQADAWKARHLK